MQWKLTVNSIYTVNNRIPGLLSYRQAVDFLLADLELEGARTTLSPLLVELPRPNCWGHTNPATDMKKQLDVENMLILRNSYLTEINGGHSPLCGRQISLDGVWTYLHREHSSGNRLVGHRASDHRHSFVGSRSAQIHHPFLPGPSQDHLHSCDLDPNPLRSSHPRRHRHHHHRLSHIHHKDHLVDRTIK